MIIFAVNNTYVQVYIMVNKSIFTDIEHSISMSLREAYLSMHRQTDICTRKHGVTGNQFVILALLSQKDGITQKELCRRAFSDPNTIRKMLVLLENRNLIERTQNPEDGRKRTVLITEKGHRIFYKLWIETEPIRRRFLTLFSIDEIELLIKDLNIISEAV